MQYTLALAQTKHPADGDVVGLARRMAREAAVAQADILLFPESLMTPYEARKEDFVAAAQALGGAFSQSLSAIAQESGLWIVYTMNEADPAGSPAGSPSGLPFNTAVALDPDGKVQGSYRKVHLFDSATTQESERMAAGGSFARPVETPYGKLGLGICYDLRFPEVARHAALCGCTLMAFPSAWVDGPGKLRQWHTLLAARALENEFFVAGTCRCDEGYIGHSAVYGPDGSLLAEAGGDEELLLCRIDTASLESMRQAIPVLDHVREDISSRREA